MGTFGLVTDDDDLNTPFHASSTSVNSSTRRRRILDNDSANDNSTPVRSRIKLSDSDASSLFSSSFPGRKETSSEKNSRPASSRSPASAKAIAISPRSLAQFTSKTSKVNGSAKRTVNLGLMASSISNQPKTFIPSSYTTEDLDDNNLVKLNQELARRNLKFQAALRERNSKANQMQSEMLEKERKISMTIEETLATFARIDLASKTEIAEQERLRQQEQKKIQDAANAVKNQQEQQERKKQEAEQEKRRILLQQENAQREQEAQQNMERQQRMAKEEKMNQMKQQQPSPIPNHSSPSVNAVPIPVNMVSDAAFEIAKKYTDRTLQLKALKKSILASSSTNMNLSNEIMRDKMLINRTVGQLTRSVKQVFPLIKNLEGAFTVAKNKSEEIYGLMMYMTAKKIVKQAETEVSVKRDSAFPLACLAIHLFMKHPLFLEIFLGRLMLKCPYVVPMYPRKQPNESVLDYKKRLGYNVKSTPIESEIQYGERMAGIITFYAAIIQTKAIKNSYGVENGWKWLTEILNMQPRKVTPLLIHAFLITAGHSLLAAYNEQALSVIKVLIDEFIPKMPQAAVASITKLQLFLEETVLRTREFPIPENSSFDV